ncbi:probable glutathione S-transferase GSTU6 isoform X2 [Zingiber officinale]|uniref:probable glutathione S-transferase GSTU6 isoform X2 n=1 Tax=Zingiber officinale TaxID=94328 RepID=UPI001C4CA78D|nr:probable glutathione S-transferase GSTU6 isoform X2 [Zingiber officinale]
MARAAAEDVKVLGDPLSPFVIRVLIALRLKRVEYEFVEVQLTEPKSEILVKSNPVYKMVPVLLHRGKPICESAVIVQYIDEEWSDDGGSSSILPADPFDRAIARFWAVYIDDKEAAKVTELAGQIRQVLGLLEQAFTECGKGKGFFGGDDVGYLDIALGSFLGWIMALEKGKSVKLLDAEELPPLAGWAERFLAEESVKGLVPDADEHLKNYEVATVRTSATPAA